MIYIILIALYLNCSTAENGPLVQTSLGKIRGFYKTSFEGRLYSAFEGIPYAIPPIGNLRFEAPQPIYSWDNVLNANSTYTCKQFKTFYNFPNMQEDCLYLNVYVPKLEPSTNDNYHVIVNIHGGAFMIGSPLFADPGSLIDRDIVYVNFNYRLGILGFLSTEDDVVTGNNGLKDQQLALKWVQLHIKSFGGNPNSVTLMGQSAGGASVHFHYFSPKSRGLFHKGISQSGNALMPWVIQENALQKARKIGESFNCQSSNTTTLIQCLKTIPADDLIKEAQNWRESGNFPLAPFAPVVEVNSKSSFLTKHPYHYLNDGEVYDVPWLTSITTDEGIVGLNFMNKTLEEVENKWNDVSEHYLDYKYVSPEVDRKEIAEKVKSFYFESQTIFNNVKTLVKIFTDRLFKVEFETTLEMQAKITSSPIYAAVYGYSKSVAVRNKLNSPLEGATHGSDRALLHDFMPSKELKLSESDILMKNVLTNFLISFVKDGKPKSNEVEWEPFTTLDPKYLLINDFNDLNMTKIPALSPKQFWDSLGFIENKRFKEVSTSAMPGPHAG